MTVDLTLSNIIRVELGAFVKTDIDLLWLNILMAAKLQPLTITPEQIAQFNSLMDTLRVVEPTCKPNDLVKILRKKLPYATNEETRRAIVEHWGALSILETQEHQGFLHQYTNTGLAPSKRHSSDWAYPVDWWTGKDGVNEDALKHWFGHLF